MAQLADSFADDGNCRYAPDANATACTANRGPSGTYVKNSQHPFMGHGSLPLSAEAGDERATVFPQGSYEVWPIGLLCDMEVLSDGGTNNGDEAIDEQSVNDDSTGGTLPDGTFDDGGDGSVCHLRTFDDEPYNAAGCAEEGAVAGGVAHAEDVVWGGDVWLTANCDWQYYVHFDPPGFCILQVLINDPTQEGISECAATMVNDLLFPETTTPIPACGGDGSPDGSLRYGRGGGDFPGLGVPYPTVTNECDAWHSSAFASVLDAIQLPGRTESVGVATGGPCDLPDRDVTCSGDDDVEEANVGAVGLSSFTMGWIDWSPGNAGTPWTDGDAGEPNGIGIQVGP